jgi:four helix bundle protein
MSMTMSCNSEVAVASSVLLDHERLDVYAVAVALDAEVVRICRRVGRGHGWLRDQAQDASGSVVLNVAEGLGREGADRARHFRYARGSAMEADAAILLLFHRGACTADDRARVRALVVREVSMLTRMLRSAA